MILVALENQLVLSRPSTTDENGLYPYIICFSLCYANVQLIRLFKRICFCSKSTRLILKHTIFEGYCRVYETSWVRQLSVQNELLPTRFYKISKLRNVFVLVDQYGDGTTWSVQCHETRRNVRYRQLTTVHRPKIVLTSLQNSPLHFAQKFVTVWVLWHRKNWLPLIAKKPLYRRDNRSKRNRTISWWAPTTRAVS